jgi:hypothetical protein
METQEGAFAYENTLDNALEFFSKAGSLFVGRRSFYGQGADTSALKLFTDSWTDNKELSMRLLLWLRDCRGGAGNRSGTREILRWLAQNDPEWLRVNLPWIPMIGRWDDLRSLWGTPLEQLAAQYWGDAISRDENILAAKWADRKDRAIRLYLGLTIGDFRRMLANMRKAHIVEHKMCSKEYNAIDYEKVPSVAMARYTKAFMKNDEARFTAFKEALKTGAKKVHADVLFPHDCIRTARHGETDIADAQFDALPNYLEGQDGDERIIVISDTSGSMSVGVAGSVCAMDISQGMALYCSGKMDKDSPFYKRFIGFCDESNFKEWRGLTFSQAVRSRSTTLLIVSDM